MSDGRLIDIIGSGWPQVLAIFGVIWWSRKIDLRSQEHSGRLDRHENRLIRIEQSIQAHALNMARVEEALSGTAPKPSAMYPGDTLWRSLPSFSGTFAGDAFTFGPV